VQKDLPEYERRGAAVMAVGQGTGEEARRFFEKWEISIPSLGDPGAVAYQAYGMLRGTWWEIVFRSLLTEPVETLRLIAKADMAGAALHASDPQRLPGVAIIERGGRLRFIHRAKETREMAEGSEIFAALDTLDARSG